MFPILFVMVAASSAAPVPSPDSGQPPVNIVKVCGHHGDPASYQVRPNIICTPHNTSRVVLELGVNDLSYIETGAEGVVVVLSTCKCNSNLLYGKTYSGPIYHQVPAVKTAVRGGYCSHQGVKGAYSDKAVPADCSCPLLGEAYSSKVTCIKKKGSLRYRGDHKFMESNLGDVSTCTPGQRECETPDGVYIVWNKVDPINMKALHNLTAYEMKDGYYIEKTGWHIPYGGDDAFTIIGKRTAGDWVNRFIETTPVPSTSSNRFGGKGSRKAGEEGLVADFLQGEEIRSNLLAEAIAGACKLKDGLVNPIMVALRSDPTMVAREIFSDDTLYAEFDGIALNVWRCFSREFRLLHPSPHESAQASRDPPIQVRMDNGTWVDGYLDTVHVTYSSKTDAVPGFSHFMYNGGLWVHNGNRQYHLENGLEPLRIAEAGNNNSISNAPLLHVNRMDVNAIGPRWKLDPSKFPSVHSRKETSSFVDAMHVLVLWVCVPVACAIGLALLCCCLNGRASASLINVIGRRMCPKDNGPQDADYSAIPK